MEYNRVLKHELLTILLAEDFLSRSKSHPIYLTTIEVSGGESFSDDYFRKLSYPLLRNSDVTLGQLLNNLNQCYDKFAKTNVFKNIQISVKPDINSVVPTDVLNYNSKDAIPTKVVISVNPRELEVGDGFLNVNKDDILNVRLRYLNKNFWGNGELVDLNVEYDPYNPNDRLVANAKVVASMTDPSLKFLVDLENLHQNNRAWRQASERSHSGLMGLQYKSFTQKTSAFTGVGLFKRSMYDLEDYAPEDVKSYSGEFLKTSLINQLSFKNLDYLNNVTKNFPVSGHKASICGELASTQEHANPNNISSHAKVSGHLDLFHSFLNNIFTFHLFNRMGAFYLKNPSVHPFDRFYLGGLDSLNGFAKNSVKPVGGLQFFTTGLTLYAKLPHFMYSSHNIVNVPSLEDGRGYESNPLRFYGSCAIGDVGDNVFQTKSFAQSLGCGIKYVNRSSSFDFGYFIALRSDSTNRFGIKDGLQFSVSIGASNRNNFDL